jgi:secretion/DNA translocation related TadE-like protein
VKCRGDRGSASIWILAAGALVVAIGVTALTAGAAVIARHQAQNAADLGALAGAARAELEPDQACAVAAAVVTANQATMGSCRVVGFDVTVMAEVPVEGVPTAIGSAAIGPAEATSRAGPLRASVAGGPATGG